MEHRNPYESDGRRQYSGGSNDLGSLIAAIRILAMATGGGICLHLYFYDAGNDPARRELQIGPAYRGDPSQLLDSADNWKAPTESSPAATASWRTLARVERP